MFTIPLVMKFSIDYFMKEDQSVQISLLETIGNIAGIILLPVIIGMLIKHYKPSFAEKAGKPVKIISVLFLSLLIIGVILKEKENIGSYLQQCGLATFVLNIATFAIGLLTAKLFRLNKKQALAVSIESGIQNSTLAISIAIVLLQKTSFAVVPSVYSLTMYLLGVMVIFLSNKIND